MVRRLPGLAILALAGVLTWHAWDSGTRWVYVPANLLSLVGLAVLVAPVTSRPTDRPE